MFLVSLLKKLEGVLYKEYKPVFYKHPHIPGVEWELSTNVYNQTKDHMRRGKYYHGYRNGYRVPNLEDFWWDNESMIPIGPEKTPEDWL